MSRIASCVVLTGAALSLSGCGYFNSRTVHKAQMAMIGMTSNDLQSCAGTPDKVTKLNGTTQLYQYSYKPSATGAFSFNPLGFGAISFTGNGSSCTALMRLDHDQVTEVHYTGDDDRTIGNDGVCEPLVRGCMRQPESTMQKVNGGPFGPVSAFSAPAIPAQSQSAVWNGPAVALPATAVPGAAGAATTTSTMPTLSGASTAATAAGNGTAIINRTAATSGSAQ
ncbi:hypothetical protein [Acetobacter fallax]|uniref:Lipoprotein n=1 Tax=Acetobacter fallax TaxID=1737473 RepID=A0ABX0K9U7_9PROT|nr:hypothetical protein [Acetobacter fallax]NHO32956.1 hypothetical protein [Acetobacter fallax]NHO36577.1 hypothetical protein [Acetobacter fallax]